LWHWTWLQTQRLDQMVYSTVLHDHSFSTHGHIVATLGYCQDTKDIKNWRPINLSNWYYYLGSGFKNDWLDRPKSDRVWQW
jgi:hypothetical protein